MARKIIKLENTGLYTNLKNLYYSTEKNKGLKVTALISIYTTVSAKFDLLFYNQKQDRVEVDFEDKTIVYVTKVIPTFKFSSKAVNHHRKQCPYCKQLTYRKYSHFTGTGKIFYEECLTCGDKETKIIPTESVPTDAEVLRVDTDGSKILK